MAVNEEVDRAVRDLRMAAPALEQLGKRMTQTKEWRRRAEKAEEQFDELSVIHNRVQEERNDALADLFEAEEMVRVYDDLAEMWRRRAQQTESDLAALKDDFAEAREVLWALRPVLQDHWAEPWDLLDKAIAEPALEKFPWLEEWLNDG